MIIPREVFSRVLLASSLMLCSYAVTASAAEDPQDQSVGANRKSRILEEVVVTGSHIRGVETASPLLVFDRTDFERAGVATVQEFLAQLPQNFGGGHSDDTMLEGLQFDASFGSAINLRGLGSSSTLVLINGHRSAASGRAEYTDISMIPLSAVQRIEVLTDGASAVYGSDAIGGVVNFIMREDYGGADTRLRYGSSTHGDAEEIQLAQSIGYKWNSGGLLLNYEYYNRDPVFASQRDFTASAAGAIGLVPSHRNHSAFLSARQNVGNRLRLFGDLLYTDRNAVQTAWDRFTPEAQTASSDARQTGVSLGLTADLGGTWQVDLTGGFSRNQIDMLNTSPSNFGGLGALPNISDYRVWSVDTKLTGDLLALPAGPLKLALGASYRDEAYEFHDRFSRLPNSSFDARAAFAELMLPLISGKGSDAPRLALSVAGRYEEYESFGSTFDPKFGLRWRATGALSLRGSYGTSFKVPSLFQLNEFNGVNVPSNVVDPGSPTGSTRAIFRIGNNASLQEETATTWTLGVDFAPQSIPGFTAAITYFDIEYEDRILTPPPATPTARLNDPTLAGLLIRRGSIPDSEFNALVADLLSGRIRVAGCAVPTNPVTHACPEPVAGINAVVETRLVNLAGTHTSGLDVTVNQRIESGVGSFDLALNASRMFDYEQRLTPASTMVNRVDTARNPIGFRARTSLTWSRRGWSAGGSLNYFDNYIDNVGLPRAAIASWSTIDLQLRYESERRSSSSWLQGLAVSLTAINAFDADPPFFADQSAGLGYDPSNADPLGRTLALNLSKRW